MGKEWVPLNKRGNWITPNFSRFGAVRKNNQMIVSGDHGLLYVGVEWVHCRETALRTKPVHADESDFRRHRFDHLDRHCSDHRMLNLADDTADEGKLNLGVSQ